MIHAIQIAAMIAWIVRYLIHRKQVQAFTDIADMWACTLKIVYLISGPSYATCLKHYFFSSTLSLSKYMSAKVSMIPVGIMKTCVLSFFSQKPFNCATKNKSGLISSRET